MGELNKMLSEALTLQGNDELDLGDPGALWTIESGGVALFSVPEAVGDSDLQVVHGIVAAL